MSTFSVLQITEYNIKVSSMMIHKLNQTNSIMVFLISNFIILIIVEISSEQDRNSKINSIL